MAVPIRLSRNNRYIPVYPMESLRFSFLALPLNAGVNVDTICQLVAKRDESHFISFINPQSWAMALRQPDYLEGLKQITMVLPDGGSVDYVVRRIPGLDCQRVRFYMSSLACPFFETLARATVAGVLVAGTPGGTSTG